MQEWLKGLQFLELSCTEKYGWKTRIIENITKVILDIVRLEANSPFTCSTFKWGICEFIVAESKIKYYHY